MSTREFVPHGKRAAAAARRRNVSSRRACVAGAVTVQYEPALGTQGQELAATVGATAEADYARVTALFGLVKPPAITVSIEQLSPSSDGSGGAWHTTCADTVLHVDASFGRADRTSALWIAEFTEVLSDVQGAGWDCGNTNGEGLSRFIAEWAYPDALPDYSEASAWLDGMRPNYVDNQQGTDTDPESNGLGVLFLWWLVNLGYSPEDIVAAGSSNLAGTYTSLTGGGAAWDDFCVAVQTRWPAGNPSGVTSDNPWTAAPPAPSPPSPPSPPTAGTLTLPADLPAGTYTLLPSGAIGEALSAAGSDLGSTLRSLKKLHELLAPLQRSEGKGPGSKGAPPAERDGGQAGQKRPRPGR